MLTKKEIDLRVLKCCKLIRGKYEDVIPEPRYFSRDKFDKYLEGNLNIVGVKIFRSETWCWSTNKIIPEDIIFTYLETNIIDEAVKKAVSVYGDNNQSDIYIVEAFKLSPDLDDNNLTLQKMNFEKVKDLNIFIIKKGRL